jgi:hypothetical protein
MTAMTIQRLAVLAWRGEEFRKPREPGAAEDAA